MSGVESQRNLTMVEGVRGVHQSTVHKFGLWSRISREDPLPGSWMRLQLLKMGSSTDLTVMVPTYRIKCSKASTGGSHSQSEAV